MSCEPGLFTEYKRRREVRCGIAQFSRNRLPPDATSVRRHLSPINRAQHHEIGDVRHCGFGELLSERRNIRMPATIVAVHPPIDATALRRILGAENQGPSLVEVWRYDLIVRKPRDPPHASPGCATPNGWPIQTDFCLNRVLRIRSARPHRYFCSSRRIDRHRGDRSRARGRSRASIRSSSPCGQKPRLNSLLRLRRRQGANESEKFICMSIRRFQ